MNAFSLPAPYISRSDHQPARMQQSQKLFPRTVENLQTNLQDFDFSFERNSMTPSTLGIVNGETTLSDGYNTKRQIIMHATKEDLIKYQNIDYMRLDTEYEMLRKEYSRLYELNAMIFDKVLNSVQNQSLDEPNILLTSTSHVHPQLKQSEYPHIPYWFKQDWVIYTKNRTTTTLRLKSAGDDDYEPLKFITNDDGMPVDRQQARYIRSTMKNIWQTLLKAKRAPPTWGQADMPAIEYYRKNLYIKFPYLKLCDNDWKVDWLATMDYPGWHRRHCEQDENIHLKREAESVPPETMQPVKRVKYDPVLNLPSPASPSPPLPSSASQPPKLAIRNELRPKARPVARNQFQSQITISAHPQIASSSVLQPATTVAVQEHANVSESASFHCVTPRSIP